MRDLIEALVIFLKYHDGGATHCEHDELFIVGVDPEKVSEADKQRLDELGFFESEDGFKSFRFGSA